MMDRDPWDPDVFTTFIFLDEGDDISTPPDGIIEMKFRENTDWAVNWSASEFPAGTGVQDGPFIPVPIGKYFVTFNCSSGEYNFESTCGNLSLIGEFNGWADDLFMTRDMDNIDEWKLDFTFTEQDDANGDGIIEIKIRENSDWTVNYGNSSFPSGIAMQDGPNFLVPLGSYVLNFNCSTLEYMFNETCGSISLIGEFNGWADDYPMHRDANDPDLWSVILTLTEDQDVNGDGFIETKFRENNDWSMNWGGDSFPGGIGYIDGPNIIVPLEYTGTTTDYLVTFNCFTGEYYFESTCGEVSIIGEFVNWSADIQMNRNIEYPHEWTLKRSWFDDSEIKFRENNDWAVNWGESSWPTGTAVLNGPNIPLLSGKYDVTFNCDNLEYSFIENNEICGEVGMVGDFNNWGDDGSGIPADVYLIRDPQYPTLFSITYTFEEATNLLFRIDADLTFQNIWGGSFPGGAGIFSDPLALIEVPGGTYLISFNCLAGDFYFNILNESVTAPGVFDIQLDGNLNEPDWNITEPVTRLIAGTITNDPNEVYFGVVYTEEYLFVGIDVTDADINAGELVEIFVDGDKSGGDYDDFDVHFTVDFYGNINVIQGPQGGINPIAFFQTSPYGYMVEIGIPLADLSIVPEQGNNIGFDVIVGDDDYNSGIDYQLAWNGDLLNYQTTNGFGDLIFGEIHCGCISLYNAAFGDVILRTPNSSETQYLATFDMDEDHFVHFRKDLSGDIIWGGSQFPQGIAELGATGIPAVAGRYRISFDCLTGEYNFVSEPPGPGVGYSKYTGTQPVIDGILDEYTLLYGSDNLAVGTGPINNSVHWGSRWDDENLYFGVDVVDAVVEGIGNPWDNDGVEIYIDGNHDEDGMYDHDFDTQIIFDVLNLSVPWIKADGVPITDYESKWFYTTTGFAVELRLAWSNFDFIPGIGRTIGWSISNNDSDYGLGRDYQTTWYGTQNNWNNTADLGDLQMVDENFVGVENLENIPSVFQLIPNPASDEVRIVLENEFLIPPLRIEVIDLSGTTIIQEVFNSLNSGTILKLNIDGLEPGIYFVKIIARDILAVNKLIVW